MSDPKLMRSEFERLCSRLQLKGVVEAHDNKCQDPGWEQLPFMEKMVSLLKEEELRRDVNAIRRMRGDSNLPTDLLSASFSEITEGGGRKWDPNVMALIKMGDWMTRDEPADLVISGPCGVGKSYVAACCAMWMINHRRSVYFIRSSRLFENLQLHRLANTLEKRKAELKKIGLLIIDDFLIEDMSQSQSSDLLDVINDRVRKRSTIFTSQFRMEGWLARLGNTPLNQAVLDRIAHSAYKLNMEGPSMRKTVS